MIEGGIPSRLMGVEIRVIDKDGNDVTREEIDGILAGRPVSRELRVINMDVLRKSWRSMFTGPVNMSPSCSLDACVPDVITRQPSPQTRYEEIMETVRQLQSEREGVSDGR